MRPSPPLPATDDFPSSPSSAWSSTGSRPPSSATQDQPSPPTPDSCFSSASAAIFSPDEFTLQIGLQLDKVLQGSPRRSPITLPQALVPFPKMDPCFMSEDGMSKAQVLLRNTTQRGNIHGRFESSPPARPRNPPRVVPVSQDNTSDNLSWESTHFALVDAEEPPGPFHRNLFIHEVSLVALDADDDPLSLDDDYPLIPDVSKQLPDTLPLNLTPTKSLVSCKQKNTNIPYPTNTNVRARSSDISIPSSTDPHSNDAMSSLHIGKPPSVISVDFATPIAHQENANALRPSLSAHRRRGHVFQFEPQLSNPPRRNAVLLDEAFTNPREPPPRPALNALVDRSSSLHRLECSLMKLEAHAPRNHRNSQTDRVVQRKGVQRKDKCPSLPPPRRLKRQHSNHKNVNPHTLPPTYGCHLSGSPPALSRSTRLHQLVMPQICPAAPLGNEHYEDITPSSFMDMDIPHGEEPLQNRQPSFTGTRKMRSLVDVAKRMSRGVIAWGKNLTGSTKSSVTA